VPPAPAPRFITPEAPLDEGEDEDGGKPTAAQPLFISNPPMRLDSNDSLSDWINPAYLRQSTVQAMAAQVCTIISLLLGASTSASPQFARDGSLELGEFIIPERYACVMRSMGAAPWRHQGPPNMQSLRVAWSTDDPSAPPAGYLPDGDDAARLARFMTGYDFMQLVALVTSRPLASVAGALRCFARGDYVLACDPEYRSGLKAAKDKAVAPAAYASSSSSSSSTSASSAASLKKKSSTKATRTSKAPSAEADDADVAGTLLDATLCCVARDEEWPAEHGGHTVYLTAAEQLLTVPAKANTLSLVLRGRGTMSTVKLVSAAAEENRYDVALTFAQEEA
jgi:hypothetical protein